LSLSRIDRDREHRGGGGLGPIDQDRLELGLAPAVAARIFSATLPANAGTLLKAATRESP
jgi:hypothetical protein